MRGRNQFPKNRGRARIGSALSSSGIFWDELRRWFGRSRLNFRNVLTSTFALQHPTHELASLLSSVIPASPWCLWMYP